MLNNKLIDFSQINLKDYIDVSEQEITTNQGGGFQINNVVSDDIVLAVIPKSVVNGYGIPYKYYENQKWYATIYTYNGVIQSNKTLLVDVYYIKA